MEDTFSFTFLGHQTWLASSQDTHILIDPVLARAFGNSLHIKFEVYPPREIQVADLPKLDAILLSHEHLDHFHIESLHRLARNIPVFVGPNMPMCVRNAIEALEFKVVVLPFEEAISIGSLEITLHAPAPGTVFWEKRVSQYLIVHPRLQRSCFVAVDALASTRLGMDIAAGKYRAPDLVIVSNNSMMTPPGARAPSPFQRNQTSLLRPGAGLAILDDLINAAEGIIGSETHIAICGDGHIDHIQQFGPFLHSDNKHFAYVANQLGYKDLVHGPYPGERLTLCDRSIVEDRVTWVAYDSEKHAQQKSQLVNFLQAPKQGRLTGVMPAYTDENDIYADLELAEHYLPGFARLLLQLPPGKNVLAVTTREWPRLGDRRIALRFLIGDGRVAQFALNVLTAAFEPDTTPVNEVTQAFPCGLELYLRDFGAILKGEIQIWDIAGRSTYSWNIGDMYQGIESVLLCDLGEQVRPELHAALYRSAIEKVRSAERESLAGVA